MKISEHITYKEATMTQTRLPNDPTEEILAVMRFTAEMVFEPVREYFGKPIAISSFYRSPAVNKKIGGAKSSQHLLGEAIDIDAQILGIVTNKQVFDYIKEYLEFDQLIWEAGDDNEPAWVHVSYTERYPLRNQILKMKNGKYEIWNAH